MDRERTLDSPTDKIMLSLTTFADELEREKARDEKREKREKGETKRYPSYALQWAMMRHARDADALLVTGPVTNATPSLPGWAAYFLDPRSPSSQSEP